MFCNIEIQVLSQAKPCNYQPHSIQTHTNRGIESVVFGGRGGGGAVEQGRSSDQGLYHDKGPQ